jgi:hypothetical protein
MLWPIDPSRAIERVDLWRRQDTMKQNVGSFERAIRVVAGVLLLALVVAGPQTWWGLIGIVPLATGLWGW